MTPLRPVALPGRSPHAAWKPVLRVLCALTLTAPAIAWAARPDLDAADQRLPAPSALANLARLRDDPSLLRVGKVSGVDERFAVPTFVWGARSSATATTAPAVARPTPESAARSHLMRLSPYYRLDAADVSGAVLRYVHDTGQGGIIASFTQQVDGIDVFRDEVKVLMDRQLELIAVAGYIPGLAERGRGSTRVFRLAADEAVARALGDFAGAAIDRATLRRGAGGAGGYVTYVVGVMGLTLPGGLEAGQTVRAKPVLFHLPGELVPSYYVEVMTPTEAEAYVIAASDGAVLMRHDLMAFDAYNYRVWADGTALHAPLDGPQGNAPSPHPTGLPDFHVPPFIAPSLLSLQNGPISADDPWLAPGATETSGNNVDAYVDLVEPDGLSAGDFRATTTSPGTFDRVYDVTQPPAVSASQQMASVTQLFFDNNFFHDWYYDAGFDEAAGNAQASNFGRGGVEGDPILAESQDHGGLNNANMSTPADGGSPRMQMYVFQPPPRVEVSVVSPASIAGDKVFGTGTSNPGIFSVTGLVARVNPGTFGAVATNAYGMGTGPEWVSTSDLNGDSRPDLATANYVSGDVTVRLADGAGGFLVSTSYPMGTGPFTVMSGDFNSDGKADLVCANINSNTFSLRLGNGDGTFGAMTEFATGTYPAVAMVGRLNGDANDDVVTANLLSSTVSVFLGNGGGGFVPRVDYPTGSGPNWVAIGDVNSDGEADLVTANYGSNSISVLPGDGLGGFGPRTDYGVGVAPSTLALTDLNTDGWLDVVTANSGDNTLSVRLGGLGGFGAAIAHAVPATPITVTAGDMNGDGLPDVVVCSDVANSVSLLPGDGAGALGAVTSFAVGTTPYGVAIGDVTGDGQPDLVSADYGSNDVTVISGLVNASASECPPYVNVLQNRIAIVDMSSTDCNVLNRILSAQNAGASAIILRTPSGSPPVNIDTSGPWVVIPVFTILHTDGAAINAALLNGPVLMTLVSDPSLLRDGAIDNAIVAHEWAHYLSNRLIGNANGLTTAQSRGMGEGWSDFNALLTMVKPEDALVASNAGWNGVYPPGSYALQSSTAPTNAYYFGVRRYPYSCDMTKSPLTFKYIGAGLDLPAGPPVSGGVTDGSYNNEEHNVGEIWCGMLWECYSSLLRDNARLTFDQARDRMRRYLVGSLKMTPSAPTFVEARDAMLALAYANDPADYLCFCAAFAKRGLGTGAVAPARASTWLTGAVESFVCGGELVAYSVGLTDDVHSCDSDGYLDSNEEGTVTVTLYNPLGSVPLSATTGTVTSTNPSLVFPLGNTISFPPSQPLDIVTGSLRIGSTAAAGIQFDDLAVQFSDPALAQPGPRTSGLEQYGNLDAAPSTVDHAEFSPPAWSFEGPTLSSASTPWTRITSATAPPDHRYFVADPESYSDRSLVSPPLHVGAEPFSFTFNHTFGFEYGLDPEAGLAYYFDGGVIELSANGGASWTDIGGSCAPGYGGTIETEWGNPLAGRAAFVGTSAAYPALSSATVSLGTAYAGQVVQVRFRLGADGSFGGGGWSLDDIAFTGITNAPFTDLTAETDPCAPAAVDDPLPTELSLAVAGRNPVVGDPVFRFALPKPSRVRIAVYDVSGRRVATLADGEFTAGVHTARWAMAAGAGSRHAGVYFARMIAGDRTLGARMVLVAR